MRRVILGVACPIMAQKAGEALRAMGFDVLPATLQAGSVAFAGAPAAQMVIADHGFVDAAGLGLFAALRERLPGVPLVLLPTPTGPADGGAPPATPAEVMGTVERLAETLRANGCAGTPASAKRPTLDPFVGGDPEIRKLSEDALKALASDSPILIEGETGTGKGVLAAWLHRHGPRAREPFVDLNCAGFSRELMDSELFGHEKGAFTGAVSAKPGLLEVADGGTLFLDEIGDMDAPIQAKLLKVIEERRFRRVGDTRERQADVRIIAATHHHLLQRVRDGLFREDLYYRIGVLPMRVPALRDRPKDIPAFAVRIIAGVALELGRAAPELTRTAEGMLQGHPWPGNLRELRNKLERAILACGTGPIEPHHLDLDVARGPAPAGRFSGGTLEELERAYIEQVLREEPHVERAAQRLGIARSTFYQKLRSLGLTPRP